MSLAIGVGARCIAAGEQAAIDYFNGDPGAFHAYLLDRKSEDERIRDMGERACSGFALGAARIFESIKAFGLAAIRPNPPSPARITYLILRSENGQLDPAIVDGMVSLIDVYKQKFPSARAGYGSHDAADRKSDTAVRKVEIVAMPERTSTTTVDRDGDLEIARTTCVEKDSG